MAVDRQDFGEEVGWVDEARKEDKTGKVLTGPLPPRVCAGRRHGEGRCG